MTTVLLSLGSNMDNPAKQLARAVVHLGRIRGVQIISKSSARITAPWGKTDQPDFLNMAVLISTTLGVEELMENILMTELKLGRSRDEKWGPRTIDIDIILFGGERFRSEKVTVPHPHMHERRFVLEPSAEIAGDMIHPELKKSVSELLAECPDLKVAELNQ